MNLLKESNYRKNNLNDLKGSFSENGYLYFKNFFDESVIVNLRNIIIDILKKESWIKNITDQVIPLLPVRKVGDIEFFKCIEAIMAKEEIHKFCNNSLILDFLEQFIGRGIIIHPRKTIRLIYPYLMNQEGLFLAHQDFYYVKGEIDTITIWIPLGNYPIEYGGLKILEGSHKKGLFPIKKDKSGEFLSCKVSDIEIKDHDWKQANYKIGDVLIFHSLTLHETGINHSDEFRLSIDFRASARNGLINKNQLFPCYYPKISAWESLTKNWIDKNLISVPDESKLQDDSINPYDALNIKKSIFFNN